MFKSRFTDHIINNVSLVELADIEGYKTNPTGKSNSCCCPFHSERTPSFHIYRESNTYYCFGCGAKGNNIEFIKQSKNYTFLEAIQYIADKFNLKPNDAELKDIQRTERIEAERTPTYIDKSVFLNSRTELINDVVINSAKCSSHFVGYLVDVFGQNTILDYLENSHLGWLPSYKFFGENYQSDNGNVVFWQIQNQLIHYGKIMHYNRNNLKRTKQPFPHVRRVGVNKDTDYFKQTFFHANDTSQYETIVILESAKSAILGALMETGFGFVSKEGLNSVKFNDSTMCQFKNKHIILVGDLGLPHEKTNRTPQQQLEFDFLEYFNKSGNIFNLTYESLNIAEFNELAKNLSFDDYMNGFDYADYLLKFKIF